MEWPGTYKYITYRIIPVANPNINGEVVSKEAALELVEQMRNQFDVLETKWVDGDLVVKLEIEVGTYDDGTSKIVGKDK